MQYTSTLKREFAKDFEDFMVDVSKDIENRLPKTLEDARKDLLVEEVLLGCFAFSLAKICTPFSMEIIKELMDNFIDQSLAFIPSLQKIYDELCDEEEG